MLRLEDENKTPIGTIRCFDSTRVDLEAAIGAKSDIGIRSIEKCRAYRLGRLVVLPEFRKHGFGSDLVLAIHRYVSEQAARDGLDFADIVLWAQSKVTPFYARFGYEVQGGEFDYDGSPHIRMVYHLKIRCNF